MTVAIDIRAMRADFVAFSKAAKGFLRNSQRLGELERQLLNASADATTTLRRQLRWSTQVGTGGAIRTALSSSHRGPMHRARKLTAELGFDFHGYLDTADHNRMIVESGATEVKLTWEDGDGLTSYHFDIHPDTAGHPLLHVQFGGAIVGVPRLHSIFAHPLDVLEFTLMELFQGTWRESRNGAKFISELKKFPTNQRSRLIGVLSKYQDWMKSSDPALLSLQKSPPVPLELYPAP